MKKRKVVIIGTGGLGRETLWAVRGGADSGRKRGFEVAGFLTSDRTEHGREVCGSPVLGAEDWIIGKPDVEAICAIGDSRERRRVTVELAEHGVGFATVIAGSVEMSEYVQIGSGCIVGARSVLTTQVGIGDHVVIGVNAVVSHDVTIEDFATLAPGVVLAGSTRIEYGAELGANATVIPGKIVGRGALVGAHSAVVEDVAANVVVAGVPAKQLRQFSPEQCL